MAMFAIGILPLTERLNGMAKQIWYADEACTGGSLIQLREWWNQLVESGPMYGYFVNYARS